MNGTAVVSGSNPDVLTAVRPSKRSMSGPHICVDAQQSLSPSLSLTDVQNFLLHTLFGPHVSPRPRWCWVRQWRQVSQVNLAVVIDQCRSQFEDYQWQFLLGSGFRLFDITVDIDLTVRDRNGDDPLWSRLFTVPVTFERLLLECTKNTADKQQQCYETSSSYGFPRSDFLLSVEEMLQDGYPLPSHIDPWRSRFVPSSVSTSSPSSSSSSSSLCCSSSSSIDTFRFSRREYGCVVDTSPLFAVDCEMCITRGGFQEVTRVSIVDEHYRVVLDSLVKPSRPVIDYVSNYSGITADMMADVETTLEEVQRAIEHLLPSDAILVGHSLNFDLTALKLYHPYTMDTSVLYNLSGNRHFRSSLQTLTYAFLGESIQDFTGGHCSVEDAVATMKLMQLKLNNGIRYGNVQLGWTKLNELTEIDTKLLLTSKKRKRCTVSLIDGKEKKLNKNKVEVTEVRCMNCAESVRLNCFNAECLCRQLVKEYRCTHCWKRMVKDHDETEGQRRNELSDPSSNSESVASFQSFLTACRLEELLAAKAKVEDNLLDVLERYKKRCFVLNDGSSSSSSSNCPFCRATLDHLSVCNHLHDACQESRVSTLVQHILEYDLNIVELTSDDRSRLSLDEMLQRVIKASSVRSLVCILLCRNGVGKFLVKIVS